MCLSECFSTTHPDELEIQVGVSIYNPCMVTVRPYLPELPVRYISHGEHQESCRYACNNTNE